MITCAIEGCTNTKIASKEKCHYHYERVRTGHTQVIYQITIEKGTPYKRARRIFNNYLERKDIYVSKIHLREEDDRLIVWGFAIRTNGKSLWTKPANLNEDVTI